jgi:hypothetical protein
MKHAFTISRPSGLDPETSIDTVWIPDHAHRAVRDDGESVVAGVSRQSGKVQK